MAEALEWVRGFNLDHPTDPVQIIGADIAREEELEPDAVVDLITLLVPDDSAELRAHYSGLASMSAPDGLAPALDAARNARDLIAAAHHTPASETALRYATAIVGSLEYRLSRRYSVVERHFVDATVRARRHLDARVVYWGGVAHVAATRRRGHMGPDDVDLSMGGMLRERFANDYVPIGLPFNRATGELLVPPLHRTFADARFAHVDLDTYLLSLTGPASGPVADWLRRPSRSRVLGPGYRPEDDEEHHIGGDSLLNRFDAVIHTQVVNAAGAPLD